jgi:hypothetical protein
VNGKAAGDTDGLTVEGFQSKMHVHSAFSGLARQLMSTVVCTVGFPALLLDAYWYYSRKPGPGSIAVAEARHSY